MESTVTAATKAKPLDPRARRREYYLRHADEIRAKRREYYGATLARRDRTSPPTPGYSGSAPDDTLPFEGWEQPAWEIPARGYRGYSVKLEEDIAAVLLEEQLHPWHPEPRSGQPAERRP